MEWLKLWIPFVGTILGIGANVYISFRQSKKQNEFQKKLNHQQQEFQKEMTQKQIDANLKAKARIEWITEVRKMSANLISSLVDIKNMNTDYEEKLAEIGKEAELLKLYFGSYKTAEIKTYDLKILMNGESNDEKNPHMFLYIDNLLQLYGTKGRENINRTKQIYSTLKKESKVIRTRLDEISKYDAIGIDNDGDPIIDRVPLNETNKSELIYLRHQYTGALNEETNYRKKIEEYYNRTEEFEKIISLYLKIEWDKAKAGK